MISPDEVIHQSKRRYSAVLRAWLTKNDIFPLTFPAGKVSPDLSIRRAEIDRLRPGSKEVAGFGYNLEYQTIDSRILGRQTVPRRVIIANLEDYLVLLRKQREFENFITDVALIRNHLPALEDWMQTNPELVIEYHGYWNELLEVCSYFISHPHPDVYIRELPIPIHTKFIESHIPILRNLLDRLLAEDAINGDATDFVMRFGLRDKPSLVRLRLLDKQLARIYNLKIDDLSLSVAQMEHLLAGHLRPCHVVIVENLINFLTLPQSPQAVGLLGGGFGVHLLKTVTWLNDCDVIYWGDIDAHGFQILSDLRGLFPNTRSVMMDRATFDRHIDFVVHGKPLQQTTSLMHLTSDGRALATHIIEQNIRLEQEHIPHGFAIAILQQYINAAINKP